MKMSLNLYCDAGITVVKILSQVSKGSNTIKNKEPPSEESRTLWSLNLL